MNGRSGFTFIELLIVLFILVIIVAVMMPSFGGSYRGGVVAVRSQLESMAKACESYRFAFGGAPGYLPDSYFDNDTYKDFTATESLVLSLMGQVVPVGEDGRDVHPRPRDFPKDKKIDLDHVGGGPRSGQNVYGSFYAPKAAEVAVIRGTLGTDNDMPEFVDVVRQLPILYYRIQPGDGAPVVKDWYSDGASVGRLANGDYLNADALKAGDGKTYDQRRSRLRTGHPGGDPNTFLQSVIAKGVVKGSRPSFVLIAAGSKGTYFDEKQGADFDDIVVFGGYANP